ncbi:site-specific integrase [Pseudomonas sp. IC_126]|uniref:site-specific integrase n=1 Tax=Pseudomonas sp. IC_126 TaxID=2547400 RepID=UPI00103BE5A8|nr:site-specific integrase [Pseudomonas sp. IC_126]TCD18671.1 site-specific integrase [Pseudomonas sp. IC_126]
MNSLLAEHIEHDALGIDAGFCYVPVSEKLAYSGTSIHYQDNLGNHIINLADFILPPTLGQPSFIRLSDEQDYINTAIAIADRKLRNAKMERPPARTLTRQLYLLRHVLDWLRSRGIYRLRDATKHDIAELMDAYAKGGWVAALKVDERWHCALDLTTSDDFELGFHYRTCRGIRYIETLRQPFWRERIGWGGLLPLPYSVKSRIEAIPTLQFTADWKKRKASDAVPVGRLVVQNTLSSLNDWCLLSPVVDRLQQRSAEQPARSSRRLSPKKATRTANLKLEEAVRVMLQALHMLYEVAPILIELLKSARTAEGRHPKLSSLSNSWLATHPVTQKLNSLLRKPITLWMTSGCYAKNDHSHTVDQVLSAIQCACAIILAAMNARRNREICDVHYGLRVDDLTVIDDDAGIYQTRFYIEKTYFGRHVFYINRTSADAIRCLEELARLSLPPDREAESGGSIFTCGRRNQRGIQGEAHLSFANDSGRTRSLVSFFQVALGGNSDDLSLSPHMFRRFYALLYFHQYEHADLRALKQQLRHLDVARTRVYVTDPSSRPLAEQIRARLGQSRFSVANEKLRSALDESYADLDTALAEVEQEKLSMAVEQILSGEGTAGGFSRIVRKLYRQMRSNLAIAQNEAAAPITKTLSGRGYRAKPMFHGQCHAPDAKRQLKAKCERGSDLAREHASARLCQHCPYHFNNQAYLDNLRDDLKQLETDSCDILLPPLQQARAAFDYDNLVQLIAVTEEQIQKNADQLNQINRAREVIS